MEHPNDTTRLTSTTPTKYLWGDSIARSIVLNAEAREEEQEEEQEAADDHHHGQHDAHHDSHGHDSHGHHNKDAAKKHDSHH